MGKCRPQDAKETTALLRQITVKSPGVIWDSTLFTVVNAESFHARNRQIIDLADELVAFRVDKSAGTTYSVDQARANGLTVKLFDY